MEKQKVVKNGMSPFFVKARCVVRSFLQLQGKDNDEVLAPVVKYASFGAICAEVAEEVLELEHMNVKTAFLDRDVDEDIYIEVSEGIKITKDDIAHLDVDDYINSKSLDLVCKLEKSMYGRKQPARCWNKKIHSVLTSEPSFTRSSGDSCLYVRKSDGGVIMIASYGDDFRITTNTKSQTS